MFRKNPIAMTNLLLAGFLSGNSTLSASGFFHIKSGRQQSCRVPITRRSKPKFSNFNFPSLVDFSQQNALIPFQVFV